MVFGVEIQKKHWVNRIRRIFLPTIARLVQNIDLIYDCSISPNDIWPPPTLGVPAHDISGTLNENVHLKIVPLDCKTSFGHLQVWLFRSIMILHDFFGSLCEYRIPACFEIWCRVGQCQSTQVLDRRPNAFLGQSLNDRTILFQVILVDKTVSVG